MLSLCRLSPAARAGNAVPGKPFTPDDNTLFICHFDDGLDADFSRGNPEPEGTAPLVAGYYGRAADFRSLLPHDFKRTRSGVAFATPPSLRLGRQL